MNTAPPIDEADLLETVVRAECVLLFRQLIHPDVIDEHLLRELGRLIGVAGPVAANRQIQQHKEVVVVNPLLAVEGVDADDVCQFAINIPANDVLIPIDGKDMVVFVEVDIRAVGAADAATAAVPRSMQGAIDDILFANIFEDIDLAAEGPSPARRSSRPASRKRAKRPWPLGISIRASTRP